MVLRLSHTSYCSECSNYEFGTSPHASGTYQWNSLLDTYNKDSGWLGVEPTTTIINVTEALLTLLKR